jgi:hypothetical protein
MKLISERIILDGNTLYEIRCDDSSYKANFKYIGKEGNYGIYNNVLYLDLVESVKVESNLNPIKKLTEEEIVPYLHLII